AGPVPRNLIRPLLTFAREPFAGRSLEKDWTVAAIVREEPRGHGAPGPPLSEGEADAAFTQIWETGLSSLCATAAPVLMPISCWPPGEPPSPVRCRSWSAGAR